MGAELWEEGEEFKEDTGVEDEAGPSNTSSSDSEDCGPHGAGDRSLWPKARGMDVEVEMVKEEVEFEQEGTWSVYRGAGNGADDVEGVWADVEV